MANRTPRPSPFVRFNAGIDVSGPLAKNYPHLGPCWVWKKRKARGYGVFTIDCRTVQVHRWAYEHFRDPIPDGMDLDHFACDNKACANPWHTCPATRGQNTARGTEGNPGNANKTLCLEGHKFSPDNTYVDPRGKRYCRICRRARDRKRPSGSKRQQLARAA